MTQAEFLAEFKAAVARPAVRLCGEGSRLRWTVGAPPVLCDPVGLVWWARTGTTHPLRFLKSLEYGIALGLAVGDVLELLSAVDMPEESWGEGAKVWREGLEGAMRLPYWSRGELET